MLNSPVLAWIVALAVLAGVLYSFRRIIVEIVIFLIIELVLFVIFPSLLVDFLHLLAKVRTVNF